MKYMTLPFLLAIVVYHNLYNSTATGVQSTLHTAAVLEDKCYISLQQDNTYNQKDVLYFFLMFHGQQAQVPHSSMYKQKHTLTA